MAVQVPPGFYDTGAHHASLHTGQVVVGTDPQLILPANTGRLGCVITNLGNATVFVGHEADVANGNGHGLMSGNSLSLVSSTAVYGAVATGTQPVTFLEEQVR